MNTIKKIIRMKTIYKIALIVILALTYTCTIQRPVSAQGEYVNFQVFYDQLSPYGEWIDYPDYGYVWVPNVGPDFEPYATSGYWTMTNYGWTWVSDYPWGWAPFHYGRWDFVNRIGWIWIPGNEWGPAWVSWRRANGYYGWAPLRPGITISMSFNLGYRDDDHWCFVHDRDFGRPDIYRYHIDRREFEPFVRNTVVINNTYIDNRRNITYVTGPGRDEVQRFTGRRISSMSVRNDTRPGQNVINNQLNIYRPRIQATGSSGAVRPAPARLSNMNDIKPANERNTAPQRNVIIPRENSGNTYRQAAPQRQAGRRSQETMPQQAAPQRQYEQPRSQQQNTQPQRQYQPVQNNQQNVQRQEKSQQIQQNQQVTPQQKRVLRRNERAQKRVQQQQPKPQEQKDDNKSEPGRRQ
jgi:hypothetical protein